MKTDSGREIKATRNMSHKVASQSIGKIQLPAWTQDMSPTRIRPVAIRMRELGSDPWNPDAGKRFHRGNQSQQTKAVIESAAAVTRDHYIRQTILESQVESQVNSGTRQTTADGSWYATFRINLCRQSEQLWDQANNQQRKQWIERAMSNLRHDQQLGKHLMISLEVGYLLEQQSFTAGEGKIIHRALARYTKSKSPWLARPVVAGLQQGLPLRAHIPEEHGLPGPLLWELRQDGKPIMVFMAANAFEAVEQAANGTCTPLDPELLSGKYCYQKRCDMRKERKRMARIQSNEQELAKE